MSLQGSKIEESPRPPAPDPGASLLPAVALAAIVTATVRALS